MSKNNIFNLTLQLSKIGSWDELNSWIEQINNEVINFKSHKQKLDLENYFNTNVLNEISGFKKPFKEIVNDSNSVVFSIIDNQKNISFLDYLNDYCNGVLFLINVIKEYTVYNGLINEELSVNDFSLISLRALRNFNFKSCKVDYHKFIDFLPHNVVYGYNNPPIKKGIDVNTLVELGNNISINVLYLHQNQDNLAKSITKKTIFFDNFNHEMLMFYYNNGFGKIKKAILNKLFKLKPEIFFEVYKIDNQFFKKYKLNNVYKKMVQNEISQF